MVCASVQEDNPRDLASGLSPLKTHNHTISCLLHDTHLHFVLCEMFDIEHWDTNKRYNNFKYICDK